MTTEKEAVQGLMLPTLAQAEPEGLSLAEWLRALAASKHGELPRGGVRRRVAKEAPRRDFAVDAIRKISFDWLSRSGGYRNLTVAHGDRRFSGRLWSGPLFETLDFGFSEVSLQVLLKISEGEWPFLAGGSILDEVFQHACFERDPGIAEGQGLRGAYVPALSVLSAGGHFPSTDALLELLTRPTYAVLIHYLDRHIARRWFACELQRLAMPASAAVDDYSRFAELVEAWCATALEAGRPDLTLLISRYFSLLMEHASWETWAKQARARAMVDFASASERQRFLKTLGRIFKVGQSIEEAFERTRGCSYIERTAADHVFLAGYHDIHSPLADGIRRIGRRLSGEIG